MTKKLFKVVCTREEAIYVAADTPEEAEQWARKHPDEWEEDVADPYWDAQAFDAKLPLVGGWETCSLCYGEHCNRYRPQKNRDVTCQEVLNGKIE